LLAPRADHRRVLSARASRFENADATIAAIRCPVRPGDQAGYARVFEPPPEWVQPDSLNLDRSFRFSLCGRRPQGWGTCAAHQTCPSAAGSASSRTGAYAATTERPRSSLAAPGWTRRFPLQIRATEFTNPTRTARSPCTRLMPAAARSSASQSQRRSLPARSPRRPDPRVRTRRMTPRVTTTEFLHPTGANAALGGPCGR
jgi:hypothetical protein